MRNTSSPVTDESKLKELVLYISAKCFKDPYFGTIKLNKILFFADQAAYMELGTPISGTRYCRYENGPAPACMKKLKQDLELSHEAYEYIVPLEAGKVQKQLLAMRPAELEGFKAAEIAILDSVIKESWNMTATQMSDKSHKHPGWRLAEEGEEIPYYTAFIPQEPIELTEDEQSWAASVASQVS